MTWPCSVAFLVALEERSSRLFGPAGVQHALRRSLDLLPFAGCWGHLYTLTIAGIFLRFRSLRQRLAERMARILAVDELCELVLQFCEERRPISYLATVLRVATPGDLWCRLSYPLRCTQTAASAGLAEPASSSDLRSRPRSSPTTAALRLVTESLSSAIVGRTASCYGSVLNAAM